MNKKLLWITRAGLFLALLIAVQFVTRSLGQLVTGSLVNLLLTLAVLTSGLSVALTVAVVSPFLAFLFGIGPAFIQIVPIVAVGNAVFVLIIWLIGNGRSVWLKAVGIVAGAAAKFLVLYFGIVKLALPLLGLPEKAAVTISAAFSYPQLITALIGGALGLILALAVNKILKVERK